MGPSLPIHWTRLDQEDLFEAPFLLDQLLPLSTPSNTPRKLDLRLLICSPPSNTVTIDTACSNLSSLALCGGTMQNTDYLPVQVAPPTSAVTTTTDSVFEGTGHVTLSDRLRASSKTAGKVRVQMPFGLVGFEILVLAAGVVIGALLA